MRPADGPHSHLGRTPQSRPPGLGPGQTREKLRHHHGEDANQAIERAKLTTWWARRVDERPVLCGVWWLWRATKP